MISSRHNLQCQLLWFVTIYMLVNISGCSCINFSIPVNPDNAYNTWSSYENYLEKSKSIVGPYRLQARLVYYSNKKIYRTKVIVWGNEKLPLRLDAMAGIGTVIAQIYEDPNATIVYSPSEQEAIVYKPNEYFLFDIEIPMPFRLYDLLSLIQGQFYIVFGQSKGAVLYTTKDNNIVYKLSGGMVDGQLTLSPGGLPVKWENSALGWSIEFRYITGTEFPNILILTSTKGNKMVFTVNSREKPERVFTPQQLKLDLPDNVVMQYVGKF